MGRASTLPTLSPAVTPRPPVAQGQPRAPYLCPWTDSKSPAPVRTLHFADVVDQRVGTHRFSPVQNKVVLSQPRPRPTAFPGWGWRSWKKAGRGLGGSTDQARVKVSTETRVAKKRWEAGRPPQQMRLFRTPGGLSQALSAGPAPLFLGWGGERNRVGKVRPEGKVLVLPAQQTQEIRSWGLPSQPETTRDNEGAARSLGSVTTLRVPSLPSKWRGEDQVTQGPLHL